MRYWRRVRIGAVLAVMGSACVTEARSGQATWAADLLLAAVQLDTAAGQLASAAALEARWTAAPGAIDHYQLAAVDGVVGSRTTFQAAAGARSLVLGSLRSATDYTVTLLACLDSPCTRSVAADAAASGRTAGEVWQISGQGNSFSGATRIIADGNTKPWAFVYGEGSPADLAGHVRLYYDPSIAAQKGVKMGLGGVPTSSPDSVATFQPVEGYGLRRSDDAQGNGVGPATFQAVPLASGLGGRVRLFFEGAIEDTKVRVYSIDSQDGYVGLDFNAGAATVCQAADYAAGGACQVQRLIGVDGDTTLAGPGLESARQAKVGYPVLNDWRWDGAKGTFMLVTAHLVSSYQSCSQTMFNAAYAVWDGSAWPLQYAGGCPKLMTGVQAPAPVHLGGARYKAYYSNNLGDISSKPIKVIHAEATLAGDLSTVDFEDWEGVSKARDVRFVWSDGSELSVAQESRLDDFVIYAPTGDPKFLVMYANMSCGGEAGCASQGPFIGMAVLLNGGPSSTSVPFAGTLGLALLVAQAWAWRKWSPRRPPSSPPPAGHPAKLGRGR